MSRNLTYTCPLRISLTGNQYEKLIEEAKENNTNKSEMTRRIIDWYFEQKEVNEN